VPKLVLQTEAADRPVRTSEVAEWLCETRAARLPVISELIDSAIATLEKEHWTQFCAATYDEYFDTWPAEFFQLRKNPAGTVESVKYTDHDGVEQTVSTDVWEQDDEDGRGIVRLAHNQSWPSDCRGDANDIVVRYTTGYGTPAQVPAPIKHAIRLWIADAYAFPETVVPLRLSKAPRTVDALMAGYSFRTIG